LREVEGVEVPGLREVEEVAVRAWSWAAEEH
jgi:hypothetical protein